LEVSITCFIFVIHQYDNQMYDIHSVIRKYNPTNTKDESAFIAWANQMNADRLAKAQENNKAKQSKTQ
jgi:hypothetical protein